MKNVKSRYYSIHGIVRIKSNVSIQIPDYFRSEEDFDDPDIEIIQEEYINMPRKKMRYSNFFFYKKDSALFIDSGISFLNAIHVIDDLLGKTKIKFTKAYGRFGDVHPLLERIISIKLIQKGYTLIHSGCLNYSGDQCFIISALQNMGKTSTILSLLDGKKFEFMSDDHTILSKNGFAYSYPARVGISPFTSTGNAISVGRTKKMLAKSQLLNHFFARLNLELMDHKEVSPELIKDKSIVKEVFVVGANGEEDKVIKISNDDAAKKILMSTIETNDLFGRYSLNLYSYVFNLDLLELFDKQRDIIKEGIKKAECFELRANKKEKYPKMVKEIIERNIGLRG